MISFPVKKEVICMSGKRITFKQRAQLQLLIESKNYKSISDLAEKIGISRNVLILKTKCTFLS